MVYFQLKQHLYVSLWVIMQQGHWKSSCHHWISLNYVISIEWFALGVEQNERKANRKGKKEPSNKKVKKEFVFQTHLWRVKVLAFTVCHGLQLIMLHWQWLFKYHPLIHFLIANQSGCQQKILLPALWVDADYEPWTSIAAKQLFNCSWKCVQIRCRESVCEVLYDKFVPQE